MKIYRNGMEIELTTDLLIDKGMGPFISASLDRYIHFALLSVECKKRARKFSFF